MMHESVGQIWHLKNYYCPNSLGTSWDAKNILKKFFYLAWFLRYSCLFIFLGKIQNSRQRSIGSPVKFFDVSLFSPTLFDWKKNLTRKLAWKEIMHPLLWALLAHQAGIIEFCSQWQVARHSPAANVWIYLTKYSHHFLNNASSTWINSWSQGFC